MIKLIPFFCLLSISLTAFSAGESISATQKKPVPAIKKNACAITINSSEEADLFKASLSPDLWTFTELAPKDSAGASKEWFAESCRAEVKCDILIVSGHFGGTFFGNSKLTLSVTDLERHSCDQKCDGILKQPKEVFLFGCNTLASKEKDHRSPEQYMQVLVADGFSAAQASQIVSFRYSGFGESFKHRMSQVFASTPRIYGFSSVGPSGKTIAPLLRTYLTASQADYANFESYNKRQSVKLNQKLATALKHTSFTQAQGLRLNMKSVEEKPYCYIRSESVTRINKLIYIHKLFQAKQAVQLLTHIQGFLHEIKNNIDSLTPDERSIWDSFANDQTLKNDLIELLKLSGDIYIPLKSDILNTLKDLDLVSPEFVLSNFTQMLNLGSTFTQARMEGLCGMNTIINIPPETIPEARWQETYFISSMLCLRPQGAAIPAKLLQVIQSNVETSLRAAAVWYFYWVRPDEKIQKELADLVRVENDDLLRQSMAIVLKQIKPTSPLVRGVIEEAIRAEKNPYVLEHLTESLTP